MVRCTQELPYARADFQLLPDDEQCLACARRARGFLRTSGVTAPRRALQQRLLMAAAAAEEAHWREYEHANLSLSIHQTLSLPDAAVGESTWRGEAGAIEAALRLTPMPPCGRDAAEAAAGEDAGSAAAAAAAEAADEAYRRSPQVLAALDRALGSEADGDGGDGDGDGGGGDGGDGGDEGREMAGLEVQVWVELDALLATLQRRGAEPAVPTQLLGLLPPPPAVGWPVGFELARVAAPLRERFEAAQSEGMAAASLYAYVPHDRTYPARRRAQRLSYAIWAVVGGAGVDLQPLLEAPSTSERLRLALLRMRAVAEQLRRE